MRITPSRLSCLLGFIMVVSGSTQELATAAEYHVSVNGSDTAAGTLAAPFRSIQRSADVMQPGDVCIIHAGTYREWIKPPRGGISEAQRITFRAAPGEEVFIKGSERVSAWTKQDGGVWRLELPDAFFGASNPFKRNLSGKYLSWGKENHLGDIYLDGVPLKEQLVREMVAKTPMSWFVEPAAGKTILHANFGQANPNMRLTEIAVRECIFFPARSGLAYLTLDGLTFAHAASQWAYWDAPQEAAVGTGYGRKWIIQNCRFTDIHCTALVCGNAATRKNDGFDAASVGRHIVRNNTFAHCGEAAIHGNRGWYGSLIEGNLIEDINVKSEFGGVETAGIKIHYAVDVTIKNNVLRRIFPYKDAKTGKPQGGQFVGIWVDWAAQGTRVTGNVIYDTEVWPLFVQNSHGSPILVDNNIFAGGPVWVTSDGVLFAHNLFVNAPLFIRDGNPAVAFWEPHTGKRQGTPPVTRANVKSWNNLFFSKGLDAFPKGPGNESDWNVFYGGAKKATWGDTHSRVESFSPAVTFQDLPDGVKVTFGADAAPREVGGPLITQDFVGEFALTRQGLEDADGNPINVDLDLAGAPRARTHPVAGPLEGLHGTNVLRVRAGAAAPPRSAVAEKRRKPVWARATG